MTTTLRRHENDLGWVTSIGYICDGCYVRSPHEHRCHRADGGPMCVCPNCRPVDQEITGYPDGRKPSGVTQRDIERGEELAKEHGWP
jgi:hypothetical protein